MRSRTAISQNTLFYLLLLLPIFFPFLSLLLGDALPKGSLLESFEVFKFTSSSLRQFGEFPLWNPTLHSGQTTSMAQLYALAPAQHLMLHLGKLFSIQNDLILFSFSLILQQAVLIFGLALLAMNLGFTQWEALSACLAMGLISPLNGAYAPVPYLLWAIRSALRDQKWTRILWMFPFVATFILFGGFSDRVVIFSSLISLWTITHALRWRVNLPSLQLHKLSPSRVEILTFSLASLVSMIPILAFHLLNLDVSMRPPADPSGKRDEAAMASSPPPLHTPKIQLISSPIISPNDEEARRIFNLGQILRKTPLFLPEPNQSAFPNFTDHRFKSQRFNRFFVKEFSPNQIKIDVDNTQNQSIWLLYHDADHPWWTAYLDQAPIAIKKADLAFKGVEIPPGIYRLSFEIRKPLVWLFYSNSIALALAIMIFLLIASRQILSPESYWFQKRWPSMEAILKKPSVRIGLSLLLVTTGGILHGTVLGRIPLQTAIEHAQVIAGVVTYPVESPFFYFLTQTWSGLHQVLAAALKLGISEVDLALYLSMMQSTLSSLWIFLMVFAITKRLHPSFLSVPLIFMIFDTGLIYGIQYPIYLSGSPHTSGVLGMGLTALVLAIIALERYWLGGALAAVGICVHSVLLGWMTLILLFTALFFNASKKERSKKLLSGILSGISIPVLSFLLHRRSQSQNLIDTLPKLKPTDYLAFIKNWDSHRNIDFSPFMKIFSLQSIDRSDTFFVAFCLMSLVALLLLLLRRSSSHFNFYHLNVRFTVDLMLIYLIFALIASFISIYCIHHSSVATTFPILLNAVRAMPMRLLNLLVMIAFPALIGFHYKNRAQFNSALSLFLIALIPYLSVQMSHLPDHLRAYELWILLGFTTASALLTHKRFQKKLSPTVALLTQVATLSVTVLTFLNSLQRVPIFSDLQGDLRNSTDDLIIQKDQSSKLFIVGPGVEYLQMRTRKPLLVDLFQLDGFSYLIDTWGNLEAVMNDIYRIDLRSRGSGDVASIRTVFESRATQAWQDLGKKYSAERVVVLKTWKLKLPLLAESSSFRLYSLLPETEEP